VNTAATSPAVRTACQVPGRVLVAGATGLLGSKVTAELLAAMPRLRGREPVVYPRRTRILLEGDRQHLMSERAELELGVTSARSPRPSPTRQPDTPDTAHCRHTQVHEHGRILTTLGTSGGRHWADLVATSGQNSRPLGSS
jgi:hypothetical protein